MQFKFEKDKISISFSWKERLFLLCKGKVTMDLENVVKFEQSIIQIAMNVTEIAQKTRNINGTFDLNPEQDIKTT